MSTVRLRRRWLSVLAVLLAHVAWSVGCSAQVASSTATTPSQTAMVPMEDGVRLATDVYLPVKGRPPYPVILIRTPYDKSKNRGLAGGLCPQGYAVAVQDMRGRFASEGHHAIIFGNDGLGGQHRDGHDTIRWITRQPWSNGMVATWGGSALGIVQNMTAPNAPDALMGRVVIMTSSDYYLQVAGTIAGGPSLRRPRLQQYSGAPPSSLPDHSNMQSIDLMNKIIFYNEMHSCPSRDQGL